MEIIRLINRIDNQVESKHTQELLLDLGDAEKASKRIEATECKIHESVSRLQELLDDPSTVEFLLGNLSVISESFESVYLNTEITLDKLKENSIGNEELYLYINKLIEKKK